MTAAAGDALKEFVVEAVSAEAIREWAVFLDDPNPLHLDADAVRAKGLGERVINQGPANLAYVMNMLMQAFPGATIDRLDTRFVDNVYAGDRLTAGGLVTDSADGRVDCDVWLRAALRDVVISGTARLILPPL